MNGNRIYKVVKCHEASEKGDIYIDMGGKEYELHNLDVCSRQIGLASSTCDIRPHTWLMICSFHL